ANMFGRLARGQNSIAQGIVEIPVAGKARAVETGDEVMPRRDLPDAREQAAVMRVIEVAHLQKGAVVPARRDPCGEQRLGLGGQQSGTVQFGRVEWLHAEAVARGEEDALPRVPECEGEFALEMRKAAYAMILIEMDEALAVRPAPEPTALLRKLGAGASVVVEFPVHHGHRRPILVCKRLVPALGFDHWKPGMAEPCPPVRR